MAISRLTGKDPVAIAHFKGQFIAFLRGDAYVRLNDIAAVTGKRLDKWMGLEGTKDLIQAFNEDLSYGGAKPFEVVKGGNTRSKTDTPDSGYRSLIWCCRARDLGTPRYSNRVCTMG